MNEVKSKPKLSDIFTIWVLLILYFAAFCLIGPLVLVLALCLLKIVGAVAWFNFLMGIFYY